MAEKSTFDYQRFEELSGRELAFFCARKETLESVDTKFLEYFQKRREFMDDVHLEYSLYILEKTGFKDVYPIVADYIDHPVTYVRIPAIRILSQWLNNYDIDEAVINDPVIMSKIERTLQTHGNLQGVEELKHVVQKKREREQHQ